MFATVQLLCLGAAAVIDTAVLLALAEPRNRRLVRLPLLLLMAAVWLWHAGLLALQMALALTGPVAEWLPWTCMLAACTGALLMPCAMTHALVRMRQSGLAMLHRADRRHALAYLPLLALIPVCRGLEAPPVDDLLAPLLPWAGAYLAWVGVVNVAAGVMFLQVARGGEFAAFRRFFTVLAAVFFGRTLLQLVVFLVLGDAWPAAAPAGRLACVLSPVISVLLLAYVVVRHDFLQLAADRSVVYAALAAGLVVLHQLLFQDLTAGLAEGWRAPLVFLEAAGLAVVVLVCPPLRRRSAEALRYGLGASAAERRTRLSALATQISAQAARPPAELVRWFGTALRQALAVDFVGGWLVRGDGTVRLRWGESPRLDDAAALRIAAAMSAAGVLRCTPRDAPAPQVAHALQAAGASLAIVRTYQTTRGLLLIGKHSRNRPLTDEEASAVHLLVEQLAVTLENGALQAERLDAERRAALTEKLSAVGLLASSITHEVKNPLSAIKTIAAVLVEDLGPDSPHVEDVRIILGEVDRLAATTTQLLDFARPGSARPGCVGAVLDGAIRVLRHLARQREVTVEWRFPDALPAVRAGEQALREIFFNLLTNALDAAGAGGRVVVTCTAEADTVIAEVRDSGPGIPADARARLFEPFWTTKPDGTGLGLYAVGRRVRELGGEITCSGAPGQGTAFVVRLPRG